MKIRLLASIATCAAAFISGCAATDTVATYAQKSFDAMLAASEGRVSYSAEEGAHTLLSPGGDAFSLGAAPDAAFSLDAAPFLAAGLDPERLKGPEGTAYALGAGRLVLSFELGDIPNSEPPATMGAAFRSLLAARRDLVGWHAALDHYGISLGGGNMIEWARDMEKNDKDLVFVLDPAPLAAAGMDPARVEGWLHAQVEMMEEGRKVYPWKLLRPFDLP